MRGNARTRRQAVFAVGLTALLLVALATVGGVGYAASSVASAVKVAKRAVAPAKKQSAVIVRGLSAGGDQYRPGFGFGDANHNHTGAPGLQGKNGEKTPPAQTKKVNGGKQQLVTTSINVDEQAALYISVLDADGKQILLNQEGSKIGTAVKGKQTKSIHYVVLVPRSIPVQLRIPANLLKDGQTYTLHVIAVDADGNKSELDVPFTG